MRFFIVLIYSVIFPSALFGTEPYLTYNTHLQSIEATKSRVRDEVYKISQEFMLTRDSEIKIDMSFHPNGLKLLNSVPEKDLRTIPIENLISLVDTIKLYIGNTKEIPYAAKKNLQDLVLERLQLEKLAAQQKLIFVDHADLVVLPEQPVLNKEVLVSESVPAAKNSAKPLLASDVLRNFPQPFRYFYLQTLPILTIIFFLVAFPLGGLWVATDLYRRHKLSLIKRRNRKFIKICQLISRRCLSSRNYSFSDLRSQLNQIPIFKNLIAEKVEELQNGLQEGRVIFWLGLTDWEVLEGSRFNKLRKKTLNQVLQDVLNYTSEDLHQYHKACLKELALLLDGQCDAVRWIQKLSNPKTKKVLHKVVPNECIAISALYSSPKETNKLLRRFPQARRQQIQQYFNIYQKTEVNTLLNRWHTTNRQLIFLSDQFAEPLVSSMKTQENLERLPSLEL